jgi:hypothetical protein
MNDREKVDCVFTGPVFGGYWIPISEVEVVGTQTRVFLLSGDEAGVSHSQEVVDLSNQNL